MVLFGQELEDFANIGRAFNTVFRIMLGDFDWDEMNDVGRLVAGIWFWTFTWLVVLVMLNMLLAIIMDVYTEVKGSMGNAETLFSQTREIFSRWRDQRRGRRVSLEYVLHTLDPTDLDSDDGGDGGGGGPAPTLSVEQLMERVPKLRSEQATEFLVSAQKNIEVDARDEVSLSDAMLRIQKIDGRQEQVHYSLEQLIHMHEILGRRMKAFNEVEKGPAGLATSRQVPGGGGLAASPRVVGKGAAVSSADAASGGGSPQAASPSPRMFSRSTAAAAATAAAEQASSALAELFRREFADVEARMEEAMGDRVEAALLKMIPERFDTFERRFASESEALEKRIVRLEKRLFPDPSFPESLAPPIPPEPPQHVFGPGICLSAARGPTRAEPIAGGDSGGGGAAQQRRASSAGRGRLGGSQGVRRRRGRCRGGGLRRRVFRRHPLELHDRHGCPGPAPRCAPVAVDELRVVTSAAEACNNAVVVDRMNGARGSRWSGSPWLKTVALEQRSGGRRRAGGAVRALTPRKA